MARTITCDVQGCTKKAAPIPFVFKGDLELDICADHRRVLADGAAAAPARAAKASAKPARTPAKKPAAKAAKAARPAKRAKRKAKGAGGRGRKAQTPEVRALYARAKAWHVGQGSVPTTHRGQISAAQVAAYVKASGDSA